MISREIPVAVFSLKNNPGVDITKELYRGIDIYQLSSLDEESISRIIQEVAPDVIHIHSEKEYFTRLSGKLGIPCVVTAHHGGITCPAGTLLNYKDKICQVKVSDKDCLPCLMKNTRFGLSLFYPWMKWIPLSMRIRIGKMLQKMPFIYFVTPIGCSTLYILNKQKEWTSIAGYADIVIAPSEAIAHNMIINGIDDKKIRIVPHGIPFEQSKSSAKSNTEKDKIRFFYVGRIGYAKGTHLLLEAFSRLDPARCELHMIGDIDEKTEKERVRKCTSWKNIFFHGKIPANEIRSFIHSFDILVHPTISFEVFGLNIAEALAEGKPVIATRCGGAEMQINDGENGLLVMPGDLDALYKAMLYLLDHPEERIRMGENAPKHVIYMRKHVDSLMEVYKTLVHNKKN